MASASLRGSVSTVALSIGILAALVSGLATLSSFAQHANDDETRREQVSVLGAMQSRRAATVRDTARLAALPRPEAMTGDLGMLDQIILVDPAATVSPMLLAGTRSDGLDLGPAAAQLARDVAAGTVPRADAMLPVGGDLFDAVALPDSGDAWPDGAARSSAAAAASRRPVLVGLRRVDATYLAEVGREANVQNLKLARMADRDTPLDPALRASGWGGFGLNWEPRRPGDRIMLQWTTFIVALTTLAALVIILRARRAARDLHASEARAVEASRNDWLSGLPNRAFFNHVLDRELASLPDRKGKLALFHLDVDRFKDINETYGIEAGDAMIRAVTRRLAGVVQPGSSLARFEGDRFNILLPDLAAPADCDRLAEAIQAAMAAPFEVAGCKVAATVSMGVALAPDDAAERPDLVRLANMALHRAKQEGRGRLAFYKPELQEDWRRRTAIERELRDAIDKGGLVLRYQPIVDAASGRVVCVEALVRWQHPTEGLIAPDRFIALAEDRGLILPLGEWVLREACRTGRHWPGIRVAVNVSPIQFRRRDFVSLVGRVLEETGFEPSCLELELTEGVLVDHEAESVAAMAELRRRGIRVALDDFGTGYSSLIYLRRFAIDKIKIDKAFVEALEPAAESAILVDSVIRLGHALGLTVTAEGVETPEQRALLEALGCHQLQGYLIARPLTAEDFTALLAREALVPARPGPARAVA